MIDDADDSAREPGETPPESGNTPLEPGETPLEPGDAPREPGETPPESDDAPREPDENPLEADDTPRESDDTPVEPERDDEADPDAAAAPESAQPLVRVPSGHRSGYVAIVGAPNAGKSTLMNRLVQERLAIVTSKPQTTRRRTLGILSGADWQMVFVDTPGLMAPRYELHHAMVREAASALRDADVVLFLTESEPPPADLPEVLQNVDAPLVLAVNKIDLLRSPDALLPVLAAWNETGRFRELVPISALEGDGVDRLLGILTGLLPEGPPFYPPDQITDQPERFFVAEIIRERLFEMYEQEVPYAAEVSIEEFKERPGAKDFIEAWIHVEQESQKAIVIGRNGQAIRALGEEAREAIEAFLERPVYLNLRVRVLPKWRKRPEALRRLGFRPRGRGRNG